MNPEQLILPAQNGAFSTLEKTGGNLPDAGWTQAAPPTNVNMLRAPGRMDNGRHRAT